MGTWDKLTGIWKNVQEVDLRPIRQAAEKELRITLLSADREAALDLVARLSTDPWRPEVSVQPPFVVHNQAGAGQIGNADLRLVLLNAPPSEDSPERLQVVQWSSAGQKTLVLIDQSDEDGGQFHLGMDWGTARVLAGPLQDQAYLLNQVAEAFLELLPEQHLSLGRRVPLLRPAIAHQLINDTAFSNAAYALSTGVAEIVPVLGLPLNIADIFVLTKAQALLVYRLGLLLGLPGEWKYYLGEFSGVVGGGFLWRQIARQLVGLIPVWGILPKVAVAYAGTYTVGQMVLRWYQTGRHVNTREIRALYRRAFKQGREIASGLVGRLPRPRRGRRQAHLAAPRHLLTCPNCETANESDAVFCKHCGQPLETDQ